MKRTFWAVAGYTAGLGTSLYVQKRVKKTVERVARSRFAPMSLIAVDEQRARPVMRWSTFATQPTRG